jgi:hypothetical protein
LSQTSETRPNTLSKFACNCFFHIRVGFRGGLSNKLIIAVPDTNLIRLPMFCGVVFVMSILPSLSPAPLPPRFGGDFAVLNQHV